MPSFGDDPRAATRQSPVSAASFAKGDVVAGKYRIEKVIGRGGMGFVFAATHLDLDQLVAIKVMHKDQLDDADAVMRFGREAKAAAAIKGNHAARIYDVGKLATGQPYLVMEHLEGRDLASLVDTRARIEISDALEWIAQACEAVAEAHELGIVHRDIKPHNLFLTRDRNARAVIKVLDFGLAKALTPEKATSLKESTTTGQIMLGSPFFMSPEQAMARKLDHRTDVWSLGATLYTIVAGVPPFNSPSINEVCAKLLTEDAPPLSLHRPDAPPELDALIRRCMTRDLDQRLGSVREMLDALRALQTARPMPSATPGSGSRPAFKATVRMPTPSSPSWNHVPVAPVAPASPVSPAAAAAPVSKTIPMAAPVAKPNVVKPQPPSSTNTILVIASLALIFASVVIVGVAIYLTR